MQLGIYFLVALIVGSALAGDGCMKGGEELKPIVEKCKKSLNLEGDGMVKPEELEKNGYDDKCLMKCIMTEMKTAKEDGTIDLKAYEDLMKKASPDKADALLALLKECMDTTAKDATISKDPCKAIAMTKTCFVKGQKKVCS